VDVGRRFVDTPGLSGAASATTTLCATVNRGDFLVGAVGSYITQGLGIEPKNVEVTLGGLSPRSEVEASVPVQLCNTLMGRCREVIMLLLYRLLCCCLSIVPACAAEQMYRIAG
jgi:hypothetical protein